MMIRWGLAALVVLVLCAPGLPEAADSSDKNLQSTLMAQEKAVIEAIKNKDKAALKELLAHEALAITAEGGRQSGADMLKSLDEANVEKYSLGDVKMVKVTDDVAVLSYKLSWTGSWGSGKVRSKTVFATSIWERHDSRWRSRFYQETPARDGR